MLNRNAHVWLRCLLVALAASIVLPACSEKDMAGSPEPKGTGRVEFTAGNDKVSTRVWAFQRFTRDGDYNFTSSMHVDKRTLGLNFRGPGAGKTITFGAISSGNYGTYTQVYGDPSTIWNITSGSMRFTEFDTAKKKVSASFEFDVQSADMRTMKITGTIADGEIGPDQLLE